jgi:hypothetical protein
MTEQQTLASIFLDLTSKKVLNEENLITMYGELKGLQKMIVVY